MKVIIDRFEGDFAVVEIEKGNFAHISKSLLPGADEGDVISVEIDKIETDNRKSRIQNLMGDLFD